MCVVVWICVVCGMDVCDVVYYLCSLFGFLTRLKRLFNRTSRTLLSGCLATTHTNIGISSCRRMERRWKGGEGRVGGDGREGRDEWEEMEGRGGTSGRRWKGGEGRVGGDGRDEIGHH